MEENLRYDCLEIKFETENLSFRMYVRNLLYISILTNLSLRSRQHITVDNISTFQELITNELLKKVNL